MTVGISSCAGFCPPPDSPWADVEAVADVDELCSCFFGGCGDEFFPLTPRLRFGERQRRKALNCRNSSPRRFPSEVRRTGFLKLGKSKL